MLYFSTLFISLFLTIAVMPLARELCIWIRAVDIPGGRKIHETPIPKGGGLAMAAGVSVPVLLWAVPDEFVKALFVGAGLVLLFGLLDDLKPLSWKTKFAGQLTAAAVVILWGGVEIRNLGEIWQYRLPGYVAFPLTFIVIVGVTNAVNLSDGLDGLAGGICLLSFASLAYLGYVGENITVTLLALAVAGAIFGFLRFNTHPATLFMGDAGSQFLGFMAVCLALRLTQGNTPLSPVLPFVILGFPILDTIAVMTERISEGRSPFYPDNKHFHHRLLRLGLFHTEAVAVIYALQAGLVSAAVLFRYHSEWLLMTGYAIFALFVTGGFLIADKTGFKFKRYDLIDRVIKGKLKALKGKKTHYLRFAFRATQIGLPGLLIATCLMTGDMPAYFSYPALGLAGMILASFIFGNGVLTAATRVGLYLLIPAAVYLAGGGVVQSIFNGYSVRLYHLAFIAVVLCVLFTLRFTRRQRGFKPSPLDFIILFLAVVVPNLPDPMISGQHMGLVATKVIMFFFSYEVLLGEMRGNVRGVALTTACALIIFALP
jgi:UDP-GlcNAc:undecaprenyl-phosphate GlcNAc-1-phosphate transferase